MSEFFKGALTSIPVKVPSATASDVLRDIDQLRRDLSGYHGQLKAHNDLQRHCDNQRERISELEGLYAGAKAEIAEAKAENAKLRELVSDFWTDMNTCHLNGDVPNKRDLDFYRPRVHEFGITDMSERELGIEVDE